LLYCSLPISSLSITALANPNLIPNPNREHNPDAKRSYKDGTVK